MRSTASGLSSAAACRTRPSTPGLLDGRHAQCWQDADMTDHDEAVAPALSPDGDIEPFAQLLATRIEHASKPAT